MKHANELMEEINRIEEKKRAEALENAMQTYRQNLPAIDELVETELFGGKGKARIMFEKGYNAPQGFYHFCSKDFTYSMSQPYYSNRVESVPFPLADYTEYLEQHGYKVSTEAEVFTGYSSTGKTSRKMHCWILVISAK